MSTLSRRKRRQSWESGTSEGSRANKTPRASIDSEISPAGPPSMVAMTTSSSSSVQRNHVHAGDLKMRIHVGNHSGAHSQSKQRKSSGGAGSGNTATGYTTTNGTGAAAHFTTSKSGRKASLAQRPSISSVRNYNYLIQWHWKIAFSSYILRRPQNLTKSQHCFSDYSA